MINLIKVTCKLVSVSRNIVNKMSRLNLIIQRFFNVEKILFLPIIPPTYRSTPTLTSPPLLLSHPWAKFFCKNGGNPRKGPHIGRKNTPT